MKIIFLLCATFIAASAARAALVVYPAPEGIKASDQYSVQVHQGGAPLPSFVYKVDAQKPDSNRSKDTSWTTFSFNGPITVAVTKLQGTFKTCKILPSSRKIEPKINGNMVEFQIEKPEKLSIEFDGNIAHPLLVFADPMEENVPQQEAPNLVYFGPGVHDIGADYEVKKGQTIYLAGGAYVRGTLRADDASNIVIRGRGILSGEQFEKKSHHLIEAKNWKTRHVLIEGITLINSPHYNILLTGADHTVRNVKMISWWFSTDGVGTARDSLVEDCFFKVNDDAIKLYWDNTTVRRCVIWQTENGAPFQISWNMPSSNKGFLVSDCDIIRAEHRWKNPNNALFDALHGGKGHMSDYIFENIRIENAPFRLFYLTLQANDFALQKEFGEISNVVFRDIVVTGTQTMPNVIKGHDAEHQIKNVRFENVTVKGKPLGTDSFEIDAATTSGIVFNTTP